MGESEIKRYYGAGTHSLSVETICTGEPTERVWLASSADHDYGWQGASLCRPQVEALVQQLQEWLDTQHRFEVGDRVEGGGTIVAICRDRAWVDYGEYTRDAALHSLVRMK